MAQEQTSAVRTRDAQEDSLAYHLGGLQAANNFRLLARAMIVEAEARGAAEQRRKDAEACGRWEFEEPEYHAQGMGCGLEDRGIHDRYAAMEYGWDQAVERCIERIPEELYTRPANVAALEARVKVLEGLVNECGNQFAFYAEQHTAKGTPESAKKAETNLRFVEKCRAALTREGGE